MKLNTSRLLIASIMVFTINACNTSSITQTSTPLPVFTETVVPTPTEWLPYNSNPTSQGCEEEFTATLPIKETNGLSQEEITQRLFEIYLAHYKSPELGSQCQLEDYKVENTRQVGSITFAVKISDVPSNWVAGNGEIALGGWIIHKSLIISVSRTNDKYILKLIGTGP